MIFGVATALEIAADKIPLVDHALDAAQTLLAPVAGVAVAMSALGNLAPPYALALGIAASAPIAGGVHLLAATSRWKSSVFTAGGANPILSVVEDALAVLGVVAAFVVPVVAVLAIVALVLGLRRLRRRPRAA